MLVESVLSSQPRKSANLAAGGDLLMEGYSRHKISPWHVVCAAGYPTH